MDLVNFMKTQSLSIGRIDQPGEGADAKKGIDKRKSYAKRSVSSNQMGSPASSPMMSIAEEVAYDSPRSPRSDIMYVEETRATKSRSRSMVENKFGEHIFRQEPILPTSHLTPSFSAPEALNEYDREPPSERRGSLSRGKSPRSRSPKHVRGARRRFSMSSSTNPLSHPMNQPLGMQKRRASFPDILEAPTNASLSSLPTSESLSSNASSPSCTSPHQYTTLIMHSQLRTSRSYNDLKGTQSYNDSDLNQSLKLEVINETNEPSDDNDMYEDNLEQATFDHSGFEGVLPHDQIHHPTLFPENNMSQTTQYIALKYDDDFEFEDLTAQDMYQ